MAYVIHHVLTVGGVGLAIYFLWALVFTAGDGLLPGTALPAHVGVWGFILGVLLTVWGLARVYR